MTRAAAAPPVDLDVQGGPAQAAGDISAGAAPTGWSELRENTDIQFEPVVIPEKPPEEPGWLQRLLEWLVENIGLGEFFVGIWPVLKWVLIAALIAAGLLLLYRLVGLPLLGTRKKDRDQEETSGWVPDEQESLALLEDADKLAASGNFDEATHLLLKRSVGQIAQARPDWVEPSSTARELSALQELPDNAREAFGVIAERVERSLFALKALERGDWEAARAAYARFALAPIRGGA